MSDITVHGDPVGKPRMTQRDKWQQRACVMRYRAWADVLRGATGTGEKVTLKKPASLSVLAYFRIPASWSISKKVGHMGAPHTVKPDGDNVLKAVLDALIANDQAVFHSTIGKYWDDGNGPRVEITLREGGEIMATKKKVVKKAVKAKAKKPVRRKPPIMGTTEPMSS